MGLYYVLNNNLRLFSNDTTICFVFKNGVDMYSFLSKSIVIIGLLFIVTPKEQIQRKIIRTDEGDFIIYVAVGATVKVNKLKTYFWYRSGEIHHATGGIGGEVLHKEYVKYYNDQQLAEKGSFHYGLKDDVWKSWHPNGKLAEILEYKKGVIEGKYAAYDDTGQLITLGRYRNGLKSSEWIDYSADGDTLLYKKGKIVEKTKDSLDTLSRKRFGFIKKWSSWVKEKVGSKKDSLERAEKRKERKEKKENSKREKSSKARKKNT